MDSHSVTLVDLRGNIVATAQVTPKGDRFGGMVDLALMPAQLRKTFEEFDELVNGQMFNLADEIEEQIAALSLRVVFPEGRKEAVEDLQIHPSTNRVSFRIAKQTPVDGMPRYDGSRRA